MNTEVRQESHGDQSPNIQAGGNVIVTYLTSNKAAFAVIAVVALGAMFFAYKYGTTRPDPRFEPEAPGNIAGEVDASGVSPFDAEKKYAESMELVEKMQVQVWDYDYGENEEGVSNLLAALMGGHLETAREIALGAVNSRESIRKPDKRAAEEFVLGGIYYIEGKFQDAQVFYEKAIASEPGNSLYLTELGTVLRVQAGDDSEKMQPAIERYRQALAISLDSIPSRYGDLADALARRSEGWQEVGPDERKAVREDLDARLAGLADDWGELSSRKRADLADGLQDIARILNNLGTAAYRVFEYDDAIDYYRITLEIRLVLLGEARSHVAGALDRLANEWDGLDESGQRELGSTLRSAFNGLVRERSGMEEEERAVFEKGLQDVGASLNNLGVVHDDLGDYLKAINYFRGGLKISSEVLGENHRNVASIYNNIGVSRYQLDDFPEAESAYEDALRIRRQVLEEGHPQIGEVLNNLGQLFFADSAYGRAANCFEQSVNIFTGSEALGPGHEMTEDAQYWLRQAILEEDEDEDAEQPGLPCVPED